MWQDVAPLEKPEKIKQQKQLFVKIKISKCFF